MKRLVLTLAILAAAQASAQNNIKPGLWELTSKIKTGNAQQDQGLSAAAAQFAAMPPEQRAKIEAMMAQNGISMPKAGGDGALTMTMCITPEMAARKEVPLNQQGQCTSKQEPVAGGLNISYTCTTPPSSGTGQLRFNGDNAYTMTMHVTNNGPSGPRSVDMESSGRWMSATCPEKVR
jgi:hypothetical protein